eukprot:4185416-Pyramimonas_sp.AAC.1
MKETWSIIIAPRPRRMIWEVGMARSLWQIMIVKGVRSSSERAIEMLKYKQAMQDIHYTLKH